MSLNSRPFIKWVSRISIIWDSWCIANRGSGDGDGSGAGGGGGRAGGGEEEGAESLLEAEGGDSKASGEGEGKEAAVQLPLRSLQLRSQF